jgi:hypothetical protein
MPPDETTCVRTYDGLRYSETYQKEKNSDKENGKPKENHENWLLFWTVEQFQSEGDLYFALCCGYLDRFCGLVVSFWLQIQRSGFDSRHYQIFWELLGQERGPLSLVSTIEELLERKSSGSCPENLDYGLGIRHADHVAHSIRKCWH